MFLVRRDVSSLPHLKLQSIICSLGKLAPIIARFPDSMVQTANHKMKTAEFATLERRVGHIASRQARRQLMHVPWDRFHKAYEDYIRWQAFVLWARAVVELGSSVPSWLEAILRKCCPGFAEELTRSNNPELLGLQLLPWVHHQVFWFAKREGWLDALVFFGFRDTRSQGYWTYWEHCETEWRKQRPASVPTLAQWRRSALRWKVQGDVSYAEVARAVEKYLDFETFVHWLRPLFQTPKVQLPVHVALELKREYPGLQEFVNTPIFAAYRDPSRSGRLMFHWGEDHVMSHARKEGWIDFAFRQINIHPRHAHMECYARLWCKSRADNPASRYPSFGEWRRDAEGYVRTGRK